MAGRGKLAAMRASIVFAVVCLSGCDRLASLASQPDSASAVDASAAALVIGCTKDTDCKGERVCENQRCVDRPTPSVPTTAASTADRPAKKWPPGVICAPGNQVCPHVCCPSGLLSEERGDTTPRWCVERPEECATATNGEVTILTCDGPEDCATGEVCCDVPSDRVQMSKCIARAKCVGTYKHPRYGTTMRFETVCHDTDDCLAGQRCVIADPMTKQRACR